MLLTRGSTYHKDTRIHDFPAVLTLLPGASALGHSLNEFHFFYFLCPAPVSFQSLHPPLMILLLKGCVFLLCLLKLRELLRLFGRLRLIGSLLRIIGIQST